MLIKDLEISKELSRKDLSAVRGGATANVGGQFVIGGGPFATTVAANSPVVNQTEVQPVTIVDLNTANVIGSLGTFIAQL